MDINTVLMLFFSLIIVAIDGLIIHYLLRLESIGCECAMDWRRYYIIGYFVLSILSTIGIMFMDKKQMPFIQSFMIVAGVLNAVFVLQYVHKLKKEKCECSNSVIKEIMTIIAIVMLILYVLVFLYVVITGFALLNYVNNKKKLPTTLSIRPRKR